MTKPKKRWAEWKSELGFVHPFKILPVFDRYYYKGPSGYLHAYFKITFLCIRFTFSVERKTDDLPF